MDARFSKAVFLSLPEDQARHRLGKELAAFLAERIAHAGFDVEVRACIDELRSLGHDLWSYDEGDDFQTWGPNYENPTGPGIVVTFSAPNDVTIEWSAT